MKKKYYDIGDMIKKKGGIPDIMVTGIQAQQITPLGPIEEQLKCVQCTVRDVQNVQNIQTGNCVHSVDSLKTPLCTRDRGAGMKNVTHRGHTHTDMRKAGSPGTTPGGRPTFRETDITGIEVMIQKWETMEGEIDAIQGEKRESRGRRVSELALMFEGGEGGNHIKNSGGGPSDSNNEGGRSITNKTSTAKSKQKKSAANNVKCNFDKIMKINTQSKVKFKSKTGSQQHDSTESGGERDWPKSTNKKPGGSERSRNTNYGS